MNNEIGNVYGSMKVIEHLDSINPTGKKSVRMVRVVCEACNKTSNKRLNNIKRKSTSGCSRECPAFKQTITKHGLTNSRTYKSWDNMVTRCTRSSHVSYEHYDNLIIGQKLDPKWLTFEGFLEDMGEPENKNIKFSIDRIDNRKGYCKSNCRWATQQEQTLNQEKSIVNIFSSAELETIRDFYALASRFKSNGVQNFSTDSIISIFSMSSPTVTKILNGYYIKLAKEKESLNEK
jgi:hypothetical protein